MSECMLYVVVLYYSTSNPDSEDQTKGPADPSLQGAHLSPTRSEDPGKDTLLKGAEDVVTRYKILYVDTRYK